VQRATCHEGDAGMVRVISSPQDNEAGPLQLFILFFFWSSIFLDAVGAASSALTCSLQGDDWRRVALAGLAMHDAASVFHGVSKHRSGANG
jgi:hypothetical protein